METMRQNQIIVGITGIWSPDRAPKVERCQRGKVIRMKIKTTTFWASLLLFESLLFFNCERSKEAVAPLLKEESMSLAILLVDYETYEFEGGLISHYEPCHSCDKDSIPFLIDLEPPLDFGSIIFKYAHTGDTLFYATIIWSGSGKIIFPDTLLSPHHFENKQNAASDPISFEYFNLLAVMPDSVFQARADSAWNIVRYLETTVEFSRYPYRVGIYLYTPAVGGFDPDAAKWIIFLYCRKE